MAPFFGIQIGPKLSWLQRASSHWGNTSVLGGDHVVERCDLLGRFVGERHVVCRTVSAVLPDSEVVDGVLRHGRGGLHDVLVLNPRYGLLGLPVDESLPVADLERVAGEGDAPLDVVLALVDRAADDRVLLVEAPAPLLLPEGGLEFAQHVVIGDVLVFEQHGVTCREVENHHVVAADGLEPLEPVVWPLDGLAERLFGLREGHRVVHEGERDRGVGHLGSVGDLAHVEVVSDEQGLFHRRGGDHVHLEEEDVHERSHDRCEDDCIDPLVNGLVGFALTAQFGVVAPDVTVEELRDVEVIDDGQSEQQPEVSGPDYEPERIEDRRDGESEPFVSQYFLDFIHLAIFNSTISGGRPFRTRPAFRRGTRRPRQPPVPACGGS